LTMILSLGLLSACGDEDPKERGPLEIIGNYVDEWGNSHQITAETWTQTGTGFSAMLHVSVYNNFFDYLAGQNDSGDTFNPGKFSRHDWTMSLGNLYYCSSAFDKDTLHEALAADSDATDLAAGCGGFSWTNLTP